MAGGDITWAKAVFYGLIPALIAIVIRGELDRVEGTVDPHPVGICRDLFFQVNIAVI